MGWRSSQVTDFHYCHNIVGKAFTIHWDINGQKVVKQISVDCSECFWWMSRLKIYTFTFSCFGLWANQCLSNWKNIWFIGMYITGPKIQHNILRWSLVMKEHFIYHTTCLSARFLLLHRSGFGFKHVLSLKCGPPTLRESNRKWWPLSLYFYILFL